MRTRSQQEPEPETQPQLQPQLQPQPQPQPQPQREAGPEPSPVLAVAASPVAARERVPSLGKLPPGSASARERHLSPIDPQSTGVWGRELRF